MGDRFRKDFTEGSVNQLLIRFAMPFLFAQLLQAFYSLTDMLIVGRYMGDYGISAVNNSSVLTMFISTFVSGFALSGTVLVAQYIGAKEEEQAQKTIGTLFTLFLFASILVTAVGLIFHDALLGILHTPSEAYVEAKRYLVICFSGTIFICGYNGVSAILRGLGDSKRPLYFVVIATVINIILDLIMVGYFRMGAGGAALATVIAQATSFFLAVGTLYKQNFIFDFKLKSFRIDKTKAPLIFKIGLPSAIQSGVVNFSFIFVISHVNVYGLAASTAVGIGSKIDSFAILPCIAFSQAVASVVGQNLGAGKYDRAKEAMFTGMRLSFLFSLSIFLLVNIFATQIMGLFRCTAETMEIGKVYIRLATMAYLFNSITFTVNGLANGAGISLLPMFTAVCNLIIARVPLIYFFSKTMGMGLSGIFLAMGCSQAAGLFTSGIFYFSGKWRKTIIKEGETLPKGS